MDIQLVWQNQSKGHLFLLPNCVTVGHISGDCICVGLVSRLSVLMHGSIHLTMHCVNCHSFIIMAHIAFDSYFLNTNSPARSNGSKDMDHILGALSIYNQMPSKDYTSSNSVGSYYSTCLPSFCQLLVPAF